MPPARDDRDIVEAEDRRPWRRWLERNHRTAPDMWLVYRKKGSGSTGISYGEAVEEALWSGWIDSKVHPLDERRYRQLFTPGKPASTWSKLNKARVERLAREGRMADAGWAVIETAKRNGSWTSLDDVEDLAMPEDFEAAVFENETARRNYLAFSPSTKKALLWRIASAKRPETRARRIEELVQLAAENRRPGQPSEREP